MFKETSLVSVLGVAELLQSVQLIYARTYQTIPLLIVACVWYLIMTLAAQLPAVADREEVLAVESPGSATGPAADRPRCRLGGEAMPDERRRNRLRATGLRKCYGDRVVLDSIDLDVACGEIVCIIGPSGSGKSTLLRCIDGLEEVDRGVLRVNGEDLGFVETTTAYRP